MALEMNMGYILMTLVYVTEASFLSFSGQDLLGKLLRQDNLEASALTPITLDVSYTLLF